MSNEDEKQVLAEVNLKLEDRLKEVAAKSHCNDLSVTQPKKWMKVAQSTFQGRGLSWTMKNTPCSQMTYYKIQRQILDIRNEYKEFQLSNIRANVDAIQGIVAGGLEQLVKEDGKIDMDLDKAKFVKEISVSGQILSQMGNRIEDGADQVIEHRKAKTQKELEQDALEKFGIKPAEVIDVDVDEPKMTERDIELADKLEILRMTQPHQDFPESPFNE